jgi:hypothetical protein
MDTMENLRLSIQNINPMDWRHISSKEVEMELVSVEEWDNLMKELQGMVCNRVSKVLLNLVLSNLPW